MLPARQLFVEEDSSTLWVMAGCELPSVDGKHCAVILAVNTLRDELVCPPSSTMVDWKRTREPSLARCANRIAHC